MDSIDRRTFLKGAGALATFGTLKAQAQDAEKPKETTPPKTKTNPDRPSKDEALKNLLHAFDIMPEPCGKLGSGAATCTLSLSNLVMADQNLRTKADLAIEERLNPLNELIKKEKIANADKDEICQLITSVPRSNLSEENIESKSLLRQLVKSAIVGLLGSSMVATTTGAALIYDHKKTPLLFKLSDFITTVLLVGAGGAQIGVRSFIITDTSFKTKEPLYKLAHKILRTHGISQELRFKAVEILELAKSNASLSEEFMRHWSDLFDSYNLVQKTPIKRLNLREQLQAQYLEPGTGS